MARTIDPIQIINSTKDYRQFLVTVLSPPEKNPRRGRLSEAARRAGLSRSFLSEVLSGKKSLTPSSFLKLQNSLRLPTELKKFFALLVAVEHDSLLPLLSLSTSAQAASQLRELRERLNRKTQGQRSLCPTPQRKVFSVDLFCVFAALGSLSSGETLEGIMHKTNLGRAAVLRALERMQDAGWVNKREERFYASERAFDFEALGPDLSFVQTFAESCALLSRSAQKFSADQDQLLFFSAFSLPSHRVREFRDEARALLLELLDKYQDDNGNAIKRVTLGIY